MKFIHRLKSAVGIGTPTLAIEGVVGPVRPGEVLRGTLVLHGGTYEVPVERVLLHFDEQHLTHMVASAAAAPDRESRRQVAAAELPLDAPVLRSGERIVREFALPLPPELAPSDGPRAYALLAEVPIAGLDPRAELPLDVVA
jgi:hypothetical protein